MKKAIQGSRELRGESAKSYNNKTLLRVQIALAYEKIYEIFGVCILFGEFTSLLMYSTFLKVILY